MKRNEKRLLFHMIFAIIIISFCFGFSPINSVANCQSFEPNPNVKSQKAGETTYNYLSNTQYNAYLSMFNLNSSDADVVFIGDSITARGVYNEFFPDKLILNRGIGSDIDEGVYNRIDEVLSHHPKQIYIMVGINDIAKGIPLDDYLFFYIKTIEQILLQSPTCDIFVESILPTNTEDMSQIRLFNSKVKEMCEKNRIEYINLFDLFLDDDGQPNEQLLSEDRIHLNGAGYKIIIEEISKRMK